MRPSLQPGACFADYRIEGVLGRGGMAVVYRAEEQRPRRMVALKVMDEERANDPGFRQRFEREADLASGLEHPNIIPVYNFGEQDGLLWLATRLVESSDLQGLLATEGPLDLDRAESIITQLARALDYAHGRGLIHRDVKPANILVVPRHHEDEHDHVYLADFGLAKRTNASVHLTRSQYFLGTAGYASPEQIKGIELDGRADIYALGCVLYQCLTGDAPFDVDSEEALLYAHLERNRPRVSDRRANAPRALDEVVARAMAIDREQRYATGRELVTGLRQALRAHDVAVPREPVGRKESIPVPPLPPPPAPEEARRSTIVERAPRERQDGGPKPSPPPRSPPSHSRRPLVIGALAGVAVMVLAGVLLSGGGGDSAKTGAKQGRASAVKAVRARVSATIALGGADAPPAPLGGGKPFGVTVGGGSVWVANGRRSVVQRVDPATNTVREEIRVDRGPTEPVVAAGALWTPNAVGDSASRVALRRPHRVRSFYVGDKPDDSVYGGGFVWMPIRYARRVVRIDPRRGRVVGPAIRVGRQPGDVAYAAGSLWVTNTLDGTLMQIDPKRMRVVRTIHVGNRPEDVAWGFGRLWVPDLGSGTVVRVDPKRGRVVGRPIPTGRQTSDVTVAFDSVWAVNHREGTVVRIDPHKKKVVERLRVGDRPIDIAAGAGALWVTNFASATLTRIKPGRLGRSAAR